MLVFSKSSFHSFKAFVSSWGVLQYERGGDARRKFWIKPLKETNLGMAQPFFDSYIVRAIILNFDYMNQVNKTNRKYIFFNTSSSATLKETNTAKYKGLLPTTPLSETTSIPAPFIRVFLIIWLMILRWYL